jgi:tetratricopeptide (TPR) repeat protein
MGDLQQSMVDRRSAADAAERVGETERIAFAYRVIAGVHLALGSWEQGRAAAHAALDLDPQRLLDKDAEVLLAWMEGRHRDALEALEPLIAAARDRGNVQGLTTLSGRYADFALQLGRFADAHAVIREAGKLVRLGTGRWGMLGNVLGQLAEVVARLGTPDAVDVIDDAEQQVRFSEQYLALPQLLRARALLLQRGGDSGGALDMVQRSASVARSQRARVQLGRSLFAMADLARAMSDTRLAEAAHEERCQIVAEIGPEVTGLDWTSDIRVALPATAPTSTAPQRRLLRK